MNNNREERDYWENQNWTHKTAGMWSEKRVRARGGKDPHTGEVHERGWFWKVHKAHSKEKKGQ